jgi:steroid delta-isomerase-like uncharacterized protein
LAKSNLYGLVQAYIEAVNRHDWDAAAGLLSPDVRLVDHALGRTLRGPEEWVARFKPFTEACPDGRLEQMWVVTEGRRLAHEVVVRGTNTGPLSLPTGEVMPATGRSIEVHLAGIWEADDEQRVTEMHHYANPMELLTQLGVTAAEAGVSAT